MTFYTEMQALATELLTVGDQTFGQSTPTQPINILVRTDTPGATAIDEPSVVWTPTQVKAVTRGVSERRDGPALLAKADKVVLIEADGTIAPRDEDKVEIGGIEFSIVSVEPTPNGETPAIFKLYVKR